MAAAFSEYDAMLDLAIILLSAILAYLAWKRRAYDLFGRERVSIASGKKAYKSLREKAGDETTALREERKRILSDVGESRKKYMKGEVDYATFVHLQRDYDAQLVDVDARLNTLYQLSGKPLKPPAELKDLLAEDA